MQCCRKYIYSEAHYFIQIAGEISDDNEFSVIYELVMIVESVTCSKVVVICKNLQAVIPERQACCLHLFAEQLAGQIISRVVESE